MKMNLFHLILFSFALALPVSASNSDDEIIKDLDFFQNMELMKDENPFVSVALKKPTATEQSDIQIKNDSKKFEMNEEKKQ